MPRIIFQSETEFFAKVANIFHNTKWTNFSLKIFLSFSHNKFDHFLKLWLPRLYSRDHFLPNNFGCFCPLPKFKNTMGIWIPGTWVKETSKIGLFSVQFLNVNLQSTTFLLPFLSKHPKTSGVFRCFKKLHHMKITQRCTIWKPGSSGIQIPNALEFSN